MLMSPKTYFRYCRSLPERSFSVSDQATLSTDTGNLIFYRTANSNMSTYSEFILSNVGSSKTLTSIHDGSSASAIAAIQFVLLICAIPITTDTTHICDIIVKINIDKSLTSQNSQTDKLVH